MSAYEDNVFINVPFDRQYSRISDGIVFAVHHCRFIARWTGRAAIEAASSFLVAKTIFERYERFRAQLPRQARDLKLDHRELTFADYTHLVVGWLTETPW